MQRRKVTFKLYPNVRQLQQLEAWTRLHCELYNAALHERVDAYRKAKKSICYYDQQNALPEIKAARPEFVALGSHALQHTLRRLDRAFQGFFRRVELGQKPGFPRFKSAARFSGFGYPDPAGWKLFQQGPRGATLRLGSGRGALMIRARGRHRFHEGQPNDLTLTRKHGVWWASVTLRVSETACQRQRLDNQERGLDLGTQTWATFDDGQTIENPRFLRQALPRLKHWQRQRARKKKGSCRYKRLSQRLGRLHERIANERKDFLHKHTTRLARTCSLLATEELQPKNLSASARGTLANPGKQVKQKAGLHREILSAGFGMAHQMLHYKAEEAGMKLHLAKTRQLKPTQRCCVCWELTPKTLADRMHHCQHCGHVMPRDQNSAVVVLIDAHTPGTGVAARPKPLREKSRKSTSLTRETPATTASAV